ncbi:MAG TPA: beta-N-acetylglucosaminidase domain-containing protein [Bacteriovoracaceae bacterium]|nr:beta-N-acetylglucosaminidase domain-containing protein [Bacteriovoracaceae bacterium]
MNIGIVEGFFGPAWSENDRKSYAEFLSEYGANFYIYAPKQDPNLRKAWREEWDPKYVNKLEGLKSHFHKNGIKFGVGFSPFGLGTELTDTDKEELRKKLKILNDLKIDILGIFFDDMPITENLAEVQLQTTSIIKQHFNQKIIFCPSFYTYDPILEKVFGKMPHGYLERIGAGIPTDVSIAWTGPKVISPVIDEEHIMGVKTLLKRQPFIWENFFANDGPRNCKFLKLKPFSGRDSKTMQETEGIALNLMNQPQLSKILFLSALNVLNGETDVNTAFDKAIGELCTQDLQKFLSLNKEIFLNKGLDVISETEKQNYIIELLKMPDQISKEILDWLQGMYTVGSECLTD